MGDRLKSGTYTGEQLTAERHRLRSKRRLANLKKGFPLRDTEALEGLPESMIDEAVEENPRIVKADKKGRPVGLTSGKGSKTGKSLKKGTAKVLDTVLEGPSRIGTIEADEDTDKPKKKKGK